MRFSKFSPDFPHSAVTGIISFTIIKVPGIISCCGYILL
ncbi:hypothetical protein ES703_76952 [subsurface metagenome]